MLVWVSLLDQLEATAGCLICLWGDYVGSGKLTARFGAQE